MKKIAFVFGLVVLQGCATVFTGTTQPVNISVLDQQTNKEISGVNCSLTNGSGTLYQLGSNPGSVVVAKGNGPLNVRCQKEGYAPLTDAINEEFNAVSLWDIFFWPTFFVDYGTGAMKEYPERYTGMMTRKK